MIEKVYKMQETTGKLIERVIQDEYLHYNHVILGPKDALPEHYSNAQVYICVMGGIITIGLNDNAPVKYSRGHMLHIPPGVKMNVSNQDQDLVEFTIVKVPPPQN